MAKTPLHPKDSKSPVAAPVVAPLATARPRTRRAHAEEMENLRKTQKQEEESDTGLRRTSRNTNAIRLKGTAPTFYRNVETLFFSSPRHQGWKEFVVGGSRSSSHKMKIRRVHTRNPPIYVIDNFLSPSDLDYFDKLIESKCPFQKSFVDNMQYGEEAISEKDEGTGGTGNTKDNTKNTATKRKKRKSNQRTVTDDTHRTSSFFGFSKLHDSKIASIERKTANLLGCWVHQIEGLQLVRYLPGQFFGVHHDMGDLLENDQVLLPKKNLAAKRRLVTLFCYLNTLESNKNSKDEMGGCTYFPKCGDLRIPPKRGTAVMWSNVTADGLPDSQTIHAGEPVINRKGVVKYGLNIWICEE